MAKVPSKSDDRTKTEEKQPEKVETIQDQGIGPLDPYPTGNPPTPDDAKEDVPNEGIQPVKKG